MEEDYKRKRQLVSGNACHDVMSCQDLDSDFTSSTLVSVLCIIVSTVPVKPSSEKHFMIKIELAPSVEYLATPSRSSSSGS
jgi:hypothetical protein